MVALSGSVLGVSTITINQSAGNTDSIAEAQQIETGEAFLDGAAPVAIINQGDGIDNDARIIQQDTNDSEATVNQLGSGNTSIVGQTDNLSSNSGIVRATVNQSNDSDDVGNDAYINQYDNSSISLIVEANQSGSNNGLNITQGGSGVGGTDIETTVDQTGDNNQVSVDQYDSPESSITISQVGDSNVYHGGIIPAIQRDAVDSSAAIVVTGDRNTTYTQQIEVWGSSIDQTINGSENRIYSYQQLGGSSVDINIMADSNVVFTHQSQSNSDVTDIEITGDSNDVLTRQGDGASQYASSSNNITYIAGGSENKARLAQYNGNPVESGNFMLTVNQNGVGSIVNTCQGFDEACAGFVVDEFFGSL